MFFVLISFVAMLTLFAIGLAIAAVVQDVAFDAVRDNWISAVNGFPRGLFYVLIVLLFIVNIPLFVLDVQLLCLHIFLAYRGLTTSEYITRQVQQTVTQNEFIGPTSCAIVVVYVRFMSRKQLERQGAAPTGLSLIKSTLFFLKVPLATPLPTRRRLKRARERFRRKLQGLPPEEAGGGEIEQIQKSYFGVGAPPPSGGVAPMAGAPAEVHSFPAAVAAKCV